MSYTNEELAKLQQKLEFNMRSVGISRFHQSDERNEDFSASQTSYNSRIINECVGQFADLIQAHVDYYTGRRGARPSYLNLLTQVDNRTTALVALRTIIDLLSSDGTGITGMLHKVGSRIEDQVKFAGLEAHAPKYVEAIMKEIDRKGTVNYSHKKRTLDKACTNTSFNHIAWDKEAVIQLGGFLFDLVGNLVFNGEQLYNKEKVDVGTHGAHSETRLVLSDSASEWISQFIEQNEVLAPSYSPCVVPPRDWTSPFDGGYHIPEIADTMSLVRGRRLHVKALTVEQMPIVYKAVNALQNVGWKVFSPVLDVMAGALECGLTVGKIPQQQPYNRPVSPIPHDLNHLKGKALYEMLTSKEQHDFINWKADIAELTTMDNKRKADLIKIGRLIEEAKRYESFESIWFVYTLDYRSRVYCTSSLLTTQGDDKQKGLLRFAVSKPLGKRGSYWLAQQGAGVWANKCEDGIALDKKPFDERYEIVTGKPFCDMVKRIIEDPLDCVEWCNADKPWQFLNWCYEWADYLYWCEAGNDPEMFMSNLPIAQDGSCSGTQHYAMMLKDIVSAKMVNLLPCPRPNDIYGEASNLFANYLLEIINNPEIEPSIKAMASEWLNHANRTLCKPPVMTLVYGSAQMTCRKTTIEYLQDIQEKENARASAEGREPIPQYNFDSISDAASFASPLIWQGVGHVQSAAVNAMKFIKKVARFSASNGQPLRLISPVGFIVTQDIRETKQSRVKTVMFGSTRVTVRSETEVLDKNRMVSSSAPNFVHCMDASHLLLTVYNALVEAGLDALAVIHDSFATHACDTDILRDILIKTLVDMYQNNDVLSDFLDLNESFCKKGSDIELPETGELDYNEVLKALYAFS